MATIAMVIQGCGKVYPIFHGSAPSSIKVEKVDLTNAAALAVMPYAADGSIQTKAGEEEYSNRLYIVDKDGKTTLASFEFKEEGNFNNKIWKKIRETLTLVPSKIIPITNDLLLLAYVSPVYDYTNWGEDAWGYEENQAISNLLYEISGSYFLRTSDGALFKSPFGIQTPEGDVNNVNLGRLLKVSQSNNQIIVCTSDLAQKQSEIWFESSDGNDFYPWVVTDKGNSFELKRPSEPLFERWEICGFILSDDNRIIPLKSSTNGTWSFDFDLNPLYIDYTPELQSILSFKDSQLNYLFDFESESYLFGRNYENGLLLYRVFENGNKLECTLVCSQKCDGNDSTINFDYYSHSAAYNSNGILFMFNGCKVSVDVKNGTITKEDFPDDFPKSIRDYDQNGIAYVFTENEILKYDLNTKKKTEVPIHWEQVDFGGYVTYSAYYSNGVFSVSGKTRTATSVTVLIDVETGDVTLTDLSEYSGPVIKSYYRLN